MKEIGKILNISTRTAESHKYEIMHTVGVKTTAELIQYAIRVGIISVTQMPNLHKNFTIGQGSS
jgi:DNA-binding NarL/FixJ family response regulator